MHRRPFGDQFLEHWGFAEVVDRDTGLYRYVRPIIIKDTAHDLQNVVLRHYREMTSLCYSAAAKSGNDLSMFKLTDAGIISVKIEGGQTDTSVGLETKESSKRQSKS